jgi:hypothetical protein
LYSWIQKLKGSLKSHSVTIAYAWFILSQKIIHCVENGLRCVIKVL